MTSWYRRPRLIGQIESTMPRQVTVDHKVARPQIDPAPPPASSGNAQNRTAPPPRHSTPPAPPSSSGPLSDSTSSGRFCCRRWLPGTYQVQASRIDGAVDLVEIAQIVPYRRHERFHLRIASLRQAPPPRRRGAIRNATVDSAASTQKPHNVQMRVCIPRPQQLPLPTGAVRRVRRSP